MQRAAYTHGPVEPRSSRHVRPDPSRPAIRRCSPTTGIGPADSSTGWPHRRWQPRRRASTPCGSWTTSGSCPMLGNPDQEMLEAYTTLGALAARTSTGEPRHARHRCHVPEPDPPRQDRHDARRDLEGPGAAAASAPPGSSPNTSASASTSLRSRSASRCSRRRWRSSEPMFARRHPDLRGSALPDRIGVQLTTHRCGPAGHRSWSAAPARRRPCRSAPGWPTRSTCRPARDELPRKLEIIDNSLADAGRTRDDAEHQLAPDPGRGRHRGRRRREAPVPCWPTGGWTRRCSTIPRSGRWSPGA